MIQLIQILSYLFFASHVFCCAWFWVGIQVPNPYTLTPHPSFLTLTPHPSTFLPSTPKKELRHLSPTGWHPGFNPPHPTPSTPNPRPLTPYTRS